MKFISVVVILLALWTGIEGQECTSFQFTEEPPMTLDCNPYHMLDTTPIWRLRTSCTVMRINDTLGAFEVHWFHKDTHGTVVDIGKPDFNTSVENEERVLFGGQLSNMEFTPDMLGEYWCQVVTLSDDAHYGRSNTVVILYPDQYAAELPVCSGTISVSSNSCADSISYPITPSSSLTTNSTTNIPTDTYSPTASIFDYTTIITTSSVTHQGMEHISSLSNTQSNVLQQSITYKGNATSSHNEPLSTKVIAGIVFSALALVAVVLLIACLIFMLASPEKRKKSVLVRRLSKRNMGYLVDMSMMRSNPLYIKFKIKKHNEIDQGHQTNTANSGRNEERHTTQNAVRVTETRTATVAVKDHQYANVEITPISNKRRASEGNKEAGAFFQGHLKHHYYTNIDTSSGSLASLASISSQLTSSPRTVRYENVSLPRETPDHTYSNQEEMGGVRGETGSHDYVNVTLTPAVSFEELT